jgi:segregation and condensation protein B
MAFNLPQVLKALLFSTSQPLSAKDVQGAFTRFHDEAAAAKLPQEPGDRKPETGGAAVVAAEAEPAEMVALEDAELYQHVPSLVTAAQIREAMDGIAAELRAANDVYLLTETAQGWRLVTQPRFARWVRVLRNEPPPLRLSPSALETLAVVAYRQPVTRAEIEAIRGVSAEAGINKLLERELIHIAGRAELPGRPIQYATTPAFLEFVGAKSIDELPASDVLSSRQIDEWLQNAANPARVGDAEMGLPSELPLPEQKEPEVTSQEPGVGTPGPTDAPTPMLAPTPEGA